jgi:hypothetical protein
VSRPPPTKAAKLAEEIGNLAEVLEVLVDAPEPFLVSQIRDAARMPEQTVRDNLVELERLGHVRITRKSPTRGNLYEYDAVNTRFARASWATLASFYLPWEGD